MAKTCTWAFIFRSDGAHPDVDYTEMMHCGNRFLIYGTNTVEEGCEVAKRIVEEYHKGRIWVKSSEVGHGTTFRIELKK